MKNRYLCLAASLMTCASRLLAAPAAPAEAAYPAFRYGGDIRLRQEIWDDIPLPTESPAIARGGYNNSYRLRSRLFGALDLSEHVTFNIRLVNEIHATPCGAKAYEWPDELIADFLNVEIRDFAGEKSRLVLGRQEFILGSGRLILDGTPLDGSRTSYVNGLLWRQPFDDDFSADLFAVYTPEEDDLAIGNVHRRLPGYSPAVAGRDEAAAGVFLNEKTADGAIAGSVYYIWKHETSARAADGTPIDNVDVHVLGLRVQPKFTETLAGDFEYAYEFDPADDEGIRASLAFAGLKWTGTSEYHPFFGANIEYLSGDDPTTVRNEAFNPILCRAPLISELVIYSYDTEGAGNWNNLYYPYLTGGFKDEAGHWLTLTAGFLGAEEDNGAGGGHSRGWLYTAQYTFPIFAGFENGRGKTSGYLRFELFDPGDYYVSDDLAYFLRWQISVAF